MNKFVIEYPFGATPLDPDEIGGLIPNYITNQGELNVLERANILEAAEWALAKTNHDCLNVSFCLNLHKRMFKNVWEWAGKTRLTDKSIGIPKENILSKLKVLLDDTDYWITEKTYAFDEIAARFHHRLVAIHVFANGNGRHARLMSEVLQTVNGEAPFTWGKSDLDGSESEVRKNYLAALRAADQGNYEPLLIFLKR